MYQTSLRKSLIINGALGRHRDGWFGAGRAENWQTNTGRGGLVDGRRKTGSQTREGPTAMGKV